MHMKNPSDGIPKEWEPLKDDDGNVVTVTPLQCQAIWRALRIVSSVRESEGYPPLKVHQVGHLLESPDIHKSRLLGRILYEGKPPHLNKPPEVIAGPAWWLVPGDPDYKED